MISPGNFFFIFPRSKLFMRLLATHMNKKNDPTMVIFVQARPLSSEMYLKIMQLLKDIQNELAIGGDNLPSFAGAM
jgi:hypothetical protein